MPLPDFSAIQAIILDMDGVLWRAAEPIGDLPEIFKRIENQGLKVALATNNATLTVNQYLDKLRGFGVQLRADQIVNSGHAAADHLSRKYPRGGEVFIIGEDGLRQALAERNFFQGEKNPLAVIVGMDRKVTYDQLSQATLLIRSGVPFIGTNPDRSFPTPVGLIPGVGAILALVKTATDVEPIIVGKPEPEMYRVALSRMSVSPEETLVVGDRIETDIVGAQKLGCRTALVLSGVTTEESARAWIPAPDWIGPDLSSLLEIL